MGIERAAKKKWGKIGVRARARAHVTFCIRQRKRTKFPRRNGANIQREILFPVNARAGKMNDRVVAHTRSLFGSEPSVSRSCASTTHLPACSAYHLVGQWNSSGRTPLWPVHSPALARLNACWPARAPREALNFQFSPQRLLGIWSTALTCEPLNSNWFDSGALLLKLNFCTRRTIFYVHESILIVWL